MGYFGCGAILQITVLVLILISLSCILTAFKHDEDWGYELETFAGVFEPQEREILSRKNHFWEVPFIITLFFIEFIISGHLVILFLRQRKRFQKTHLSRIITFAVGGALIGSSIFPLISAFYYESHYDRFIEVDKRTYHYTSFYFNGTIFNERSPSVVYYCKFGHGRPLFWSRLKGLRIKKFGSKICQDIGLKFTASFLSFYAGCMYMTTLLFLDSNRRDKEAGHLAMLFDLFGDLEESKLEHPGGKFDPEAYKRDIMEYSYRHVKKPSTVEKYLKEGRKVETDVERGVEGKLARKIDEFLRTGKFLGEDIRHQGISKGEKVFVSPYVDEQIEDETPEWMRRIQEVRLKREEEDTHVQVETETKVAVKKKKKQGVSKRQRNRKKR